MTTNPVAFVDTETLGLDPRKHVIWEVAVITPDGAEHLWQIKWSRAILDLADPVALEINGFHDRYGNCDDLVSPHESAERFAGLTGGLHLAGAVVSFDEERLRSMHDLHLGKPEGKYPWHYRLICVESMMLGAAGASISHPFDPRALAADLGVHTEPATHHSALGDARWARAVYRRLTDG